MKPVRGSERGSSKTPKATRGKGKKEGKNRFQQTVAETQDPGTSSQAKKAETKSRGKRKGTRKVNGQEKWKPLPKSSIVALGKMFDLSILSVLATQRTEKQETQKQLNILKEKFLAKCAKLPVPNAKLGDLMHLSHQLEEETKKAAASKTALRTLQADVEAVVSTLESLEEQNDSLESTCSRLRHQLEEEELKAEEMLRQADKGVLGLPTLPPRKESEATLHDRMMGMVPIANRESVARKLGKVLHRSAPIRDAQAFLVHAHKHADQLPRGGQGEETST